VRSQAPDEFNALAVNFKRANNILRELGPTTSFPFNDGKEGLVEDAERELHSAIERWRATWSNNGDGSLAQADYERRLRSVAQLTGPVDRFFREVRVDVENQYLKQNRLFLLESMIKPIYRIADISKLGGQS
jgi:glycyl-tRNA synthetase beta chain